MGKADQIDNVLGRLRSSPRILSLSSIWSGSQLIVGASFLQLGIFAAGVQVARAEGPRSFGLYSAAFALGSAIVGGATAGLPILLLKRASEGDINRLVLRRAALLQLCLVIPAVLITAIVGALVLGGSDGAVAGGAGGLLFAIINVARLGQNVHSGRRRYHRSAATDVVAGTLFPILTHVALELQTGIVGSLVAISIAWAIACSVAWTRLPALEFGRTPSRLRLRDGLSFTVLGLMHTGYGRVDTVLIVPVAGAVVAGTYSAAYRLLGPFSLIGTAFSTMYFSRLCEYSTDRVGWMRVRRRGTILLATVAIGGTAASFIAAPLLIRLFYGSSFEDSVTPARILVLSILPWALWLPKSAELASLHIEGRATIGLAFGLVLDVLLIIVLGRRFGASGAAWAWVISQTALLLILVLMTRGIAERVPPPGPDSPASAPNA